MEREGIDLSDVKLTHHKLSHLGKRDLGLSGGEEPKLKPITEAGSGSVQEKQKAILREIIEQLNDIYGVEATDGDMLSNAQTLMEKLSESAKLQKQAANNSKEQFANSPDLPGELLNALMDSMDIQTELSTKALNSQDLRDKLLRLMLNHMGLYEKLKGLAVSA